MTQPTFQELLTSQEARDKVIRFVPQRGMGSHYMLPSGTLMNLTMPEYHEATAVWQGYLQEAAPPPEPRVFSKALYFNVYDDDGIFEEGHLTRNSADEYQSEFRLACVRVEIQATEGQFDD